MPNTMKWILIGASDIASTRIIPAMRERGDGIAAVVSRSAERAQSFGAENGIPVGSDDLTITVAATKPNAAYISSLNELHYEHAKSALFLGLHVLCEKPLTLTVAESEELADLAEERGLVLAVNHHLPGSVLHRTVRQLVSSGAIGIVLSARIAHAVSLPERLRGWRIGADSGAGVILDITCHDASVLNPLLGEPVRVSAIAVAQADWNTGSAADAAMVTIEYKTPEGRSVIAQTHDAFTVANEPTRLIVHGTSGVITADDAMTQDADGTITLLTADGARVIEPEHQNLYSIVLDAFAAAVAGDGRPTADVHDGLEAARVALAALTSQRTGTTVELASERTATFSKEAV
jgi:1,5-anhydro-D-fructose reductase (1,5-anhydro-D-mannitol-forming)